MYVGEFRDGLMDGNGAMITAITGMRNEGIWTNGENVGWVEPEFSPEEAKRAMQIKDDPTLDVYVNLFLKQNEEAIVYTYLLYILYMYIYIYNIYIVYIENDREWGGKI